MVERLIPTPESKYRRLFEALGYDNVTLAVYGLAEFATVMERSSLLREIAVSWDDEDVMFVLFNFKQGYLNSKGVSRIIIGPPSGQAASLLVVDNEDRVKSMSKIDTVTTRPNPEDGSLLVNFFSREGDVFDECEISCLTIIANKNELVSFEIVKTKGRFLGHCSE